MKLENPARRRFLKTSVAAPILLCNPRVSSGTEARNLTIRKREVPLVGRGYPATEIWGYNGEVPGPLIRARRGELVRLRVTNQIDQQTTVHWHGLRIQNSMDGVPGLTQPPIDPGDSFEYQFTPPDAGTFWYHSHVNSSEQIGRGLYGALIVDEADPPPVDRDVVWILDDWLLDREARIINGFDHPRDASHGGQIGNTVTINGRIPRDFFIRRNERLRLRLVNAANGRIFRLKFEGHSPVVIAMDGQPVRAHEPQGGIVVLGPAMRTDLILDCTAESDQRYLVIDEAYGKPYELVTLAYGAGDPLRTEPVEGLPEMVVNGLREPDLDDAVHLDVTFGGGVHGGLAGASYQGQWIDVRGLFRLGKMWAINGIVGASESRVPLYTLKLHKTYLLHLSNETAWPHPVHMHGHHFRMLNRNGEPEPYQPWLDTVLLGPREKADVALVADNPGSWMFHCHIPEHMATGMTTILLVT